MTTTSAASSVAIEAPGAVRRTRCSFFFVSAAALLAVVLAAFTPTFYLQAHFEAPPMPPYVSLHGAVLTAWFVGLVVQAALAGSGRTALHRGLGIAGVAVGGAVVATAAAATLRFVPRLREAGVDIDGALAPLSGIVWGDAGLLAAFVGLLTAAVAARRRPQAHKRLMLIASIALMPPALARVGQWFEFGGVDQVLFALGGLLFLLAVVVAHDVISSRRVHGATWLGVSVVLVLGVGALAAGGSDFARSVVRSLG